MIRRNTWIILVLFLALLAGTLFWNQTKGKAKPTATPAPVPTSANLFDLGNAAVVGLTVQDAQGKMVIFKRDANALWVMTRPAEAIDTQKLQDALTNFTGARIIARPESVASLADFGLEPPAYRILLVLDSGKQVTLNISQPNSIGTGYYVLDSETRQVYVVSKSNLDTVLDLLENPPYPPTPTPTETPAPGATETGVPPAESTLPAQVPTSTVTP